VINSSHFYKNDLETNIETIRRLIGRDDDESYWLVEKNLFTSAYIIRKLIENYKLSDSVTSLSIPVLEIPLINGAFIDVINNHKIFAKYEWSKLSKSSLGIKDAMSVLMHSFVFNLICTEVNFLAVNTFERKNKLYILNVENLLALLFNVATDDVTESLFEKKIVYLSDGKIDRTQPRLPKMLRRGDHCEPMKKTISFNEVEVNFFKEMKEDA
jgi:hypothetical protein